MVLLKNSILHNGIQLLTEEIPYANSVSIGFWIKVGSRHESENTQGITHFIEHLLFKGTEKRTTKQIAEELEMVGGSLNAFTSKEYTCIYARVLKEDIDLATDLLIDMIFNSCFKNGDIDKEKNVICEEILMYEDTPDEIIHDIFIQKTWHGHSLSRAILGSRETVSSLRRQDIVDYYNKHFTPENIIISAAGNFKQQELEEKLNGLLPIKNNSVGKHFAILKPEFKPVKYTKIKDTEQMHICLGTKGLHQDSEQLYPLMIFNNLLGGGISSRLFQSVREELALAYSIYSYLSVFSDGGLFVIYAGTSPKNSGRIIEEIYRQIKCLDNNGLNQIEIENSKCQLRGNILLNMESVSYRMSRLGRNMLTHNRIIDAQEVINDIMKVTMDDLYSLRNRLLDFSNYSLITLGPHNINKIV